MRDVSNHTTWLVRVFVKFLDFYFKIAVFFSEMFLTELLIRFMTCKHCIVILSHMGTLYHLFRLLYNHWLFLVFSRIVCLFRYCHGAGHSSQAYRCLRHGKL